MLSFAWPLPIAEKKREAQGFWIGPYLPSSVPDAPGVGVEVPFYPSSSCALPQGWAPGVADSCFHEGGGKEACDVLFKNQQRVSCYCGALGGSLEQCLAPEGEAGAVSGRLQFLRCAEQQSLLR